MELRPVTPDEFPAWAKAGEASFGSSFDDEQMTLEREVFEFDRSLGWFDQNRVAATSALFTTSFRVPGGADVPTAFVTWVSVGRSHRRKGLLRSMMSGLLDDGRDRGEPLAALFASEATIYGRFGFGAASTDWAIRVPRYPSSFRGDAPTGGEIADVDLDEAARRLPAVYDSARGDFLAMPTRTERWWRSSVLSDPEKEQEGATAKQVSVHSADGSDDGYAIWRAKEGEDDGVPALIVEVEELVAATPAAEADLWRALLDVDLSARLVTQRQPRDTALLSLLADPRRASATRLDGLWVRFVDLPAALEARTWTGSGRVVVAVHDAFRPDQSGTFALEVDEGHAAVTRVTAEPDIELDTADLAATYLCDHRLSSLRRAGLIREHAPGACERYDALCGISLTPFTPEVF